MKSTFKNNIQAHLGNALEVLPKLEGPFDLVFIDADKVNYDTYFEQVLPKTRKGGLIISDNVMWSGKVIQKPDPKDVSTIALQDYYNNLIIKTSLYKESKNIREYSLRAETKTKEGELRFF